MAAQPVFKKTTLKNGLRVVSENHPDSNALAMGIFVETGTRFEPRQMIGVSHFVEHLVFKGTKSKSSYQIAKSLEVVGGELNAYTTREYTCFHTLSLSQDWSKSVEILMDLVSQAKITAKDFELEKQVVLQEINMSSDLLEDYIFDLFFEKAYAGNALGRQILGTNDTIQPMKRRDVFSYYKGSYGPKNLIVSAAGKVDHDELVSVCEKLSKGNKHDSKVFFRKSKPKMLPIREVIYRPSEQVHILMGLPAATFKSDMRFEAYILNCLLGGGMTSKLYQKVREKQGLVYNISSQLNTFIDAGNITIYAGTERENVKEVVNSIYKELLRIKEKGITRKEVELFKTQVRGGILLGSDDVDNRMTSLGINEMVFKRYRPVSEIIDEIDQVNVDTMNGYLDEYLDFDQLALMLMGNIQPDEINFSFLS